MHAKNICAARRGIGPAVGIAALNVRRMVFAAESNANKKQEDY